MEKNKKLVLSSIVLMSTALLGVTLVCNKGLTSFSVVGGDVPSHNLTLTEANAPTLETEYQASVTYTGVEHTQFTFTNVKAAEDALCTLGEGGTLTKVDAALGLESVTVTFTGTLTVETRFTDAGAVTEYPLTSGVETFLCGNYFAVTASTETTITSLSLNYLCTSGYNEGHELHETTETVLNGTDLDKIWKCQYCDYKEARVDKAGFNTYRTGSLVAGKLQDANLLTTANETIGGVVNPYKLSPTTASSWNNVVHFDLLGHTNDLNGMTTAQTRNNILTNYDIYAASFKIYFTSGSHIRLAAPDPEASTKNSSGNAVYHSSSWLNPGTAPLGLTNNRIMVVDENNKIPATIAANTWYTVYVTMPDISKHPSNQYHCIEIVTPAGTTYYSDVRYWHDSSFKNVLSAPVDLGFVYNTTNTGAATLTKVTETVAGKEVQYKSTGAGTWRDQIDVSWASNNTVANGGMGDYKTSWYYNKHVLETKSYSFDVYLSAGASVRIQSRNSNSANDSLTNVMTAGGTYISLNNGTFNSNAKLYDANGTEIAQNGAIAGDAWYTVVVDLTNWNYSYFSVGGYFNVSLVAPSGTIYLANLTHNR